MVQSTAGRSVLGERRPSALLPQTNTLDWQSSTGSTCRAVSTRSNPVSSTTRTDPQRSALASVSLCLSQNLAC